MPTIYQSCTIEFPSTAAGTAEDRYAAWPFLGDWVIESVRFAPATAVSIDGSDNLTATISTNDGAGGSYTAIGSHTTDTGGTALAVDTSIEVSLTTTAAAREAREVSEGSMIKVAKTEGGNGEVLDGCYTIRAIRIA